MKVLRVVSSMDPQYGGVVEAIHQSAMEFSRDEVMDVLCADAPNSTWILKEKNYAIHAVGKGVTPYWIQFNLLLWLWRNAKNYDVVILDGLWQFLSWGGYLLKFQKIPYCVFVHGMLDPYFTKSIKKYLKKLPFWFLVERQVIAMAVATIFTSKEEESLAAQSFPLYVTSSQVSVLGVRGNTEAPDSLCAEFLESYPILRNVRMALFLGRIDKKKGIDMLIDALSLLDKVPSDFVLAIAGPDNVGLKADLEKRIDSLGLSDRIFWLGMLNGNVKWGAYHAAEVFVLPSHQENFGIVVAESLSTGTPVLITDKVNIWREVLGCGFVESDDLLGVRRLFEQWFSLSLDERVVMKGKALDCYNKKFSADVVNQSFSEMLHSLSKV